MKKPKVLLYDIETAPNLAYVWGKYDQNVIDFKKEWTLLSFAYKWLGSNKVHCHTVKGAKSDRQVAKKLHKLFNEADVMVAHNGDEFDYKKVKARFIYHDLEPVKLAANVDTRKVAKRYFNFNSNSLNDLGRYLKVGRKIKHEGFSLWLGCMKDDAKSWETMVRYNKQDVLLLERIYKKFLPWMHTHPNMALLRGKLEGCPKCGSKHVIKKGIRANNVTMQQQWQCKKCLGWFLTRRSK